MKSIGELLKSERKSAGKSLNDLQSETKIKSKYISAIEAQNWDLLPDFPVVVGFVKNIAAALNIDKQKAVATLRRDYPPKKAYISPKPDVGHDFKWGPRLTFALLAALAFLIIAAYLVFQYWRFQKPPELIVDAPTQGQLITSKTLQAKGKVESSTSVSINGQPALVDEDGNFVYELEINKDTQEVTITAHARSGKETVVKRNIRVEF